jgi:hypothetical protein
MTLKALLPKAKKSKRHQKAAPYKDVPGIVRALRARQDGSDTAVNQAAEFIILTYVSCQRHCFQQPLTKAGDLCSRS